MNDVINRKDAIGAILSIGHIAELKDGDAVIRVSAVNYVLRNLPSADVQAVVRCKDCKHWNDAPADDGFNSCEMDALIRHESFFCANGERKDD